MRRWLHIHVTGFEIQSRNCPLHFSDCRQSKAVSEAAVFSLSIPQALSGSQPSIQICEERYSVVPLLRECFIIPDRTTVCQCFLNKFLNIFRKVGNTILFVRIAKTVYQRLNTNRVSHSYSMWRWTPSPHPLAQSQKWKCFL